MGELNPYQALPHLILVQTSASIKVRRQRKFHHQNKTKSWSSECQNPYIEQTSAKLHRVPYGFNPRLLGIMLLMTQPYALDILLRQRLGPAKAVRRTRIDFTLVSSKILLCALQPMQESQRQSAPFISQMSQKAWSRCKI